MIKNSLHHILILTLGLLLVTEVSAQSLDHRQGEFIICLHSDADPQQWVNDHQKHSSIPTQLQLEHCLSRSGSIWKASFDFTEIGTESFANQLRNDARVRIIQKNHLLKRRTLAPNDPLLQQQWQWLNIGAHSGMDMSSLSKAWDISTGGKTVLGDEIVVASIDVGVFDQHEDLNANIWYNEAEIPGNGIDDDNNGYVDDYRGWNVVEQNDNIDPEDFGGSPDSHGTEILGTIGSVGNNGNGLAGVNWNVKMMNVYFNSDLNEADMIGAYGYILEQRKLYNESDGERGAFVVASNLSYGDEDLTPEETPIWCAVYDMLGEEGILNCAATANEELDIDEIKDVPTSCPSAHMISVTATDINDRRTFAAFGKEDIDLAAPGSRIYTTTIDGYGPVTGTSYAAPMVAGAIALLYASPCSDLALMARTDPMGAALLAKDFLFNHVDKIEELADEVSTGGRLNVLNALAATIDACSACAAPFGIEISADLDTTLITWSQEDSVSSVVLEYRLAGDTIWTTIDSAVSPVLLTNLDTCQTYEVQLTATCLDSSMATSAIETFSTSFCCQTPENVQVIGQTDQSLIISWDSVMAAASFDLRYRPSDSITWDTIVGISENSYLLDSLLPCAEYTFQVRSLCSGSPTQFGDTLVEMTKGCGPCLDSVYCELDIQPFGSEWIERFSLNEIDNTSGYNEGYGDFTGSATTLKTNNSYELTFEPGFSGDTLDEHYFAWIDYNQNGAFENETELIYASEEADSNLVVQGNFTVPFDAPEGLTRLRVMMLFSPLDTVFGCGTTVDLGEAEDYCVNIVFDSLICQKPTGLDTANFAGTATDIVWERVDSAIAYTIRYRQVGDEEWEEIADTATTYSLSELDECAEYEVQVQAVCMQDTSGYTESLVFATFCNTSAHEISIVDYFQVSPNPFQSQISIELISRNRHSGQLRLYNTLGTMIYQRSMDFNEGSSRVTLDNLAKYPPGIYVLTYETGMGIISRKLLKS